MSSNEEDSGEKKSYLVRLIGGPAIIALIPIVAYLLGISFYQGYLSTFGVDSDIFPISTQYVYLNAYHAVTYILIDLFYCGLLKQTNFSFVFIILLNVLILVGGFWWLKKKDQKKDRSRIEKYIAILCIVLLCYPLLLLFLLGTAIFWWSPSRAAYSAGQKIAQKKIDSFNENGCSPDQKTARVKIDTCSIIQDKDGKTLHEGLLVVINDKDLAIFKKDGIYTFPRQKNWVIRRKLHKTP